MDDAILHYKTLLHCKTLSHVTAYVSYVFQLDFISAFYCIVLPWDSIYIGPLNLNEICMKL